MKKTFRILIILLMLICLVALTAGLYIQWALPNTGEPADIKIEITPKRVERGRYLANHVTLCIDCHSSRDWSLFSGPMKAGTEGIGGELFDEKSGFPGEIYASNITPFKLDSWTDGELLRAITTGVNKEGKALFPLMSYSRFGKMDQEDIYSIIAYIRTLKPVDNAVPASHFNFPFSLINKTLPAPANFQKLPNKQDTLNYGAYLINAAGCMDCHSKMENGKLVPGTAFGGGMEFKQAAGTIRSPNITMDNETGLGRWTQEAFIKKFKWYADSAYKPVAIAANELNSPMPWIMYAGMEEEDLGAIYTYLKSLAPINNQVTVRSMD